MSALAKLWSSSKTTVLWAAAGVLEAPCLFLAAGWPLDVPPLWGVAAHVGASVLVFFAPPKQRGWFKPTRHWGEPLGLLTFLVPGFGWAMAGWAMGMHRYAPLDKNAYRFEDEASDDGNPAAGAGTPEAVQRELADALDVLPAVDALHSSSLALKRGAIETLGRIRTSEAIAWIMKARTSPEPEVRFYATTALTRLKRDFETTITAAQKESWRSPADVDAQVALQRARYDQAVAGVLDDDATFAALRDCRASLEPLAARSPEALRLLYLVVRRLVPAAGLELLDRLETADPGKARRWTRERAELLFELGHHGELRGMLKARRADILSEKPSDEERSWQSAALWWTDG